MRLSCLYEATINLGWERTVRPTEYYISKSDAPFTHWSADDIVAGLQKMAFGSARSVARKYGLPDNEVDDLAQSGLIGLLRDLRKLQDGPEKSIDGKHLLNRARRTLFSSMIQGGSGGENWRSSTVSDLRVHKTPKNRNLPDTRNNRQQIVPDDVVAKASGLGFGVAGDKGVNTDFEDREELSRVLDGMISDPITKKIMRRLLSLDGVSPENMKDLASEFGVSPQMIGNRFKKGLDALGVEENPLTKRVAHIHR